MAYECPDCGRIMQIPESHSGRPGHCRKCGCEFIVPEPGVRACIGCGRDTNAKDGICSKCRAGRRSPGSEESRGRPLLPPKVSGMLEGADEDG
jgi:hypothetical protein